MTDGADVTNVNGVNQHYSLGTFTNHQPRKATRGMNSSALTSRTSLRSWTRRAAVATAAALALVAPTALTPAQAAPPSPIDHLGRPAPHVLDQIDQFAKTPGLPPKVRESLEKVTGFFRGDGKPGVNIPIGGPSFTQFAWPTISAKCIGGKNNAIGTAMAVPGPAKLPLPGVKKGEVNFVFTGLGTGTVAKKQTTRMNVHWVNVNNGRTGMTTLGYNGLNPKGPATVNGAAKTGTGTVIALLEGGVSTFEEGSGHSDCNFAPTVAMVNAR